MESVLGSESMHSSAKEREMMYLEEEHKWKVISLPGPRIKAAKKWKVWKRQKVLVFRPWNVPCKQGWKMTRGENLVGIHGAVSYTCMHVPCYSATTCSACTWNHMDVCRDSACVQLVSTCMNRCMPVIGSMVVCACASTAARSRKSWSW